jgi:Ca-activated chloride channel family protein
MRADFSLDYDVLTVERPQKLYLLARLQSGPAADDQQRRPLNLSLVIDHSGSMAGDKIDFTRQAAQFLVQNLGIQDVFSVVLYSDKVDTLIAPGPVSNKDLICQRIGGIKVGGTTNLSGGWLEGCKLVAENLSDDRLNRVILMSDGLANRGITETEKLVAIAQQKRGERISTTTMGMGTEFNESLLMAMADAGGGAYYFIESPEVAPLIFKEELQGLLSVVGQNLVISVESTDPCTPMANTSRSVWVIFSATRKKRCCSN